MATARRLLMIFFVVVSMVSIGNANGAVTGVVLSTTLLQSGPGTAPEVETTLSPNTALSVLCRSQNVVVFDDPWWLQVTVVTTTMTGWVADYYVQCEGSIGNCNVALC